MQNILKIMCVLTSIIFSLTLSGCQSQHQLHEKLIVQGICVDKVGDEFNLAISVFDAESTGSSGSSDSKDQKTNTANLVECKGKSVLDAFMSITNLTGKAPIYSQNLILIIGKETAESGISSLIDFFVRHYEARPSVEIFVANSKASDVMKCKLNDQKVTPNLIYDFANSKHSSVNVMGLNLVQFITHMKRKTSDPNAMFLKVDGEKVSAEGSAIFLQDKMVDVLDSEETEGALLVNGELSGGSIAALDIQDIGTVTYTITSSKSKISPKVVNGQPEFNIEISIKAAAYEIEHPIHKEPSQNTMPLLEQKLKEHLEQNINQVIKKCVMKHRCDIFDFGRRLMKTDPSYFKTVEDDWRNVMVNANYNVTVNAQIEKTGQEMNPAY